MPCSKRYECNKHTNRVAALKSMFSIPRSPSLPPLEDRDARELGYDEIAELQRQSREAKVSFELNDTLYRDQQADDRLQEQLKAAARVKQEPRDDSYRSRKKARPTAGDMQLEIDANGSVREDPNASSEPAAER